MRSPRGDVTPVTGGVPVGLPVAFLAVLLLLGGCESLNARPPAGAVSAEEIAGLAVRADQAYREDDWTTAASAYARLTAIAPDEAEHWFRRANACVQLNRLGEAVRLYGETLQRNPNHAGAWHNLGMAQLQLAARSFNELEARATDDEAARLRARRIVEGVTELLGAEQGPGVAREPGLESLKYDETLP